MALLENGLKTTLGGLAVGIGVAVVAPVIVPILASIAKPLTKAIIKEGLILYKTGQETVAEAREAMEDLASEAKLEIADSARVAAKKKKASPRKQRTIVKAIKDEGNALYSKGKSMITETKEALEQIVEEAKAEIASSAAAKEGLVKHAA